MTSGVVPAPTARGTVSNRKPRGTYLAPNLIDSEAFRRLTLTGMKVLIGFRRRVWKRQLQNPRTRKMTWEPVNDQELFYTYTQIQEEWDIKSRSTVSRVIDQLLELGFLDIVATGMGLYKSASEYGLSDRWRLWHPDLRVRRKRGFKEQRRQRHPNHPGFQRTETREP